MPGRFPQLHEFEVLAELGSGPVGTVYKVINSRNHEVEALKRLDRCSADLALDAKRAFQALIRLEHSSLVPLHGFFEDGGVYFTREYVDGIDLLSFCVQAKRPHERLRRVVYSVVQVVKALAFLHGQGLAHANLKPRNVLASGDGRVKLTDAGVSREPALLDPSMSAEEMAEARAYAAPARLHPREADLWSLGLMLYELLGGHLPRLGSFAPASGAELILHGHLELFDTREAKPWEAIVHRLLPRRPTEGYATAQALLADLRNAWQRQSGSDGHVGPGAADGPGDAATPDGAGGGKLAPDGADEESLWLTDADLGPMPLDSDWPRGARQSDATSPLDPIVASATEAHALTPLLSDEDFDEESPPVLGLADGPLRDEPLLGIDPPETAALDAATATTASMLALTEPAPALAHELPATASPSDTQRLLRPAILSAAVDAGPEPPPPALPSPGEADGDLAADDGLSIAETGVLPVADTVSVALPPAAAAATDANTVSLWITDEDLGPLAAGEAWLKSGELSSERASGVDTAAMPTFAATSPGLSSLTPDVEPSGSRFVTAAMPIAGDDSESLPEAASLAVAIEAETVSPRFDLNAFDSPELPVAEFTAETQPTLTPVARSAPDLPALEIEADFETVQDRPHAAEPGLEIDASDFIAPAEAASSSAITEPARAVSQPPSPATDMGLGESGLRRLPRAFFETRPLPLARSSQPDALRLAGRDGELQRLETAWEETVRGANRVVVLSGEAGVGKTRLVEAFAARAEALGSLVFSGRATPGPDGSQGDALSPLLAALARFVTGPEARAWPGITREDVAALFDLAPGSKLSAEPRGESGDSSPAKRRYKALGAASRLLRAIGERRPVLLVFEDLHAAHDASLEIIVQLVWTVVGPEAGQRIAVMPIMSFRNDEAQDRPALIAASQELEQGDRAVTIELARLSAEASTQVAAYALDSQTVPVSLARFLNESCAGNPLYVQETLKGLLDDGIVVRRGDGLEVNEPLLAQFALAVERGEARIPAVIAQGVKSRLLRLSTSALEALQVASLMGREFPVDVVKAVTGLDPQAAAETLDELKRARLACEVEGGKRLLRFDHPRMREVVLAGIRPRTRQTLMGRVAQALEAHYGDKKRDHAVLLAELYERAGVAAKALEYLPRAAELRAARGDQDGAIAALRRVLELIQALPAAQRGAEARHEFEARRRLARLLLTTARLEEAEAAFGQIKAWAKKVWSPHDEVDATLGLAETSCLRGRHAEAAERAKQALEGARSQTYAKGEADAIEILAVVSRRRHEMRAAAGHLRDVIHSRKQLRDRTGMARALASIGLIFRNTQNDDKAFKHFHEALALFGQAEDRRGVALATSLVGSIQLRRGEYDAARRSFTEAFTLDEEMGNARGVALGHQNLGYLALSEGDYRIAMEHFERSVDLLGAMGDTHHGGYALINLGHTHFRTGNNQAAVEFYDQALSVVETTENAAAASEAASGLALAVKPLDPDRSQREARRAVTLAQKAQALDKEAWARLTLSKVERSPDEARRALDLAERVGDHNLILMTHHHVALLELEAGRKESARSHFQKAFYVIDSIAERAGGARERFLKKPAVEAIFRDAQKL